jgi:hypothetical protein
LSACSVYWYMALLDLPPMRRSCAACRNAEAPVTRLSRRRRRAMICSALTLRTASGLSAMYTKPVLVAPLPPVKAITFSTPGSLLMMPTICWTAVFITGNDASSGPRTEPVIAPVSCSGKNPLGILMTR